MTPSADDRGQRSDPATTRAADDTGADISGRFRYQAGYAALLAVGMLEEPPPIRAVYCEHHDDVLVELDDGKCDAVQVKSQSDGVGPLKGTSEPVLRALKHFVGLEHAFAARFRRYHLASISGFHRQGSSATNLPRCLDQARSCTDPEAPEAPLKTLIARMKVAGSVPAQITIATLTKVRLNDTLPKIADMESRVRKAIEGLPGFAHFRTGDLAAAAVALIDLAETAGRATEGTAASDYMAYLDDPSGHASRSAIEAKRLEAGAIRELIDKAATEAQTLRSKGESDALTLPDDLTRAHLKMEKGGLPIHTVAILDDLRSSVEYEINTRLYRDGQEKTRADYDHLQILVRTIAEDARLAAARPDAEYGPAMYQQLRNRLTKKHDDEPQTVRGLSPEQLTGLAAMLTELCKVWWSDPFDVEAHQ